MVPRVHLETVLSNAQIEGTVRMTLPAASLKDKMFRGQSLRSIMKKAPLVVAFWLMSQGIDVRAQDFAPTSTLDSVNGTVTSLRDAIIATNGSTTVDRVLLNSGTYALSLAGRNEDAAATGDLDITRDVDSGELTIEGTGMATTIIDGAGIDRVFQVTNGAKVKFKNLTIKGGLATDSAFLLGKAQGLDRDAAGGGVLSTGGVLVFENVSIESNQAVGLDGAGGSGFGGVYGGTAAGGGIYATGGSLTFTGGAVKNNQANAGAGQSNVLGPGGGGYAYGGGIGTGSFTPLTGTGVAVTGNSAVGGVGGFGATGYGGATGGYSLGGGIQAGNRSNITLTDSKINSNTARSGAGGKGGDGYFNPDGDGGTGYTGGYGGQVSGGGLYTYDGDNVLTNCEISDNQAIGGVGGAGGTGGGSISGRGGMGGTGAYNYAVAQGGGIYAFIDSKSRPNAKPLTLVNCSVARNKATGGDGGAGGAGGTGNSGAGSQGYGGSGSPAQGAAIHGDIFTGIDISNSTISNNVTKAGNGGAGLIAGYGGSVGYGGALSANTFFSATLSLKNSTVVQNSSQVGTGFQNGSTSFGGGIYNGGNPTLLVSSIVAQNTVDGAPRDISVTVDDQSTNNIIGDSTFVSGLTGAGNLTGTTAAPLDPKLDTLKNNGGLTETHALLAGSPALEAGVANGLTFDQRGDGYPRTEGLTDIGAFEHHAPVADAGGPYTIDEGSPLTLDGSLSKGDSPLTYTWDINGDGTFGDATGVGPTLTGAQLTALGLVGGQTYTVTIKVNDGISPAVTDTATLKVNVVAPNSPPTVSPEDPVVGGTVVVTVPGTGDTTFDWGDGATTTTNSHAYTTPGSYEITVTTKNGSTTTTTKLTVVVSGDLKIIRLRGGLGVSGAKTNLVRLTADIPNGNDLKVAGQKIVVDVGGAVATFTFDGKGRVKQDLKDNGGSLSKVKKDGTRRLFISMLGDWLPNWADEKVVKPTGNTQVPTDMLVKVTIEAKTYSKKVKIFLSPRFDAVRIFDSNSKRPGG
jgi:hypothetical protein